MPPLPENDNKLEQTTRSENFRKEQREDPTQGSLWTLAADPVNIIQDGLLVRFSKNRHLPSTGQRYYVQHTGIRGLDISEGSGLD